MDSVSCNLESQKQDRSLIADFKNKVMDFVLDEIDWLKPDI